MYILGLIMFAFGYWCRHTEFIFDHSSWGKDAHDIEDHLID